MRVKIFATAGKWALASDDVQWVLLKRRGVRHGGWTGLSFVRSTRDVLAQYMRQRGIEQDTAVKLLSGLPETFDQWIEGKREPE